jgi:hypothetical protein
VALFGYLPVFGTDRSHDHLRAIAQGDGLRIFLGIGLLHCGAGVCVTGETGTTVPPPLCLPARRIEA